MPHRSRFRDSALLSWVMFVAAFALLGAVVWTRATSRGAWQPELEGKRLGEIPVMDFSGNDARIVNPATLYFFEAKCLPCAPAARQLNAYAATRGGTGLAIYAVTNSPAFSSDSARVFGAGIRPLRLSGTTRELSLIRELPLVVRTDPEGRVERAWVGELTPTALAILNAPRQASP